MRGNNMKSSLGEREQLFINRGHPKRLAIQQALIDITGKHRVLRGTETMVNGDRTAVLGTVNVSRHTRAIHSIAGAEGRDDSSLNLLGIKARDKSVLVFTNGHSQITFVGRHVTLAISNTETDTGTVGRKAPTEP